MRDTLPNPALFGLGLMATPGAKAPAGSDAGLGGLMARAQAGDAAAYSMLLRDCLPLIRRVATARGVRGNLLDDVVQDTLLTIHRARHTYDPARPFAPWLRAIVQRRAIDALRRTGRQQSREVSAPLAYEQHADEASGAEEEAAARGRAERLAEAVRQLPPGQREALELLGMQERTLAEASVATGRSTVALKVNLHRALKALRRIMGAEP